MENKSFIAGLASVLIFFILLASLVFLPGCSKITGLKNNVLDRFNSEKKSDAAVDTVRQFFDFLTAKDYDSAYKLVYEPAGSERNLEGFKKEFTSVTEIVSIDINWVEVKNNIAVVGIDMIDTYDGEEKIYKDIQVSLVRDDDESWKINFWNEQAGSMNFN